MPSLARSKPRFGPAISIEEEVKSGAIAYWQGEYCQSRADKNGVSPLQHAQRKGHREIAAVLSA